MVEVAPVKCEAFTWLGSWTGVWFVGWHPTDGVDAHHRPDFTNSRIQLTTLPRAQLNTTAYARDARL